MQAQLTMLLWLALILALSFGTAFAPAPYSNDLRTAIVFQRLVLRRPATVVAAENNVSVRSVQRYIRRYRRLHTLLPDWDVRDCNAGRNPTITRMDLLLLVRILLDEPTLYLDELQDRLVESGGQRLSIYIIHRWLRRIGITRQRLWRVKYTCFCHSENRVSQCFMSV